MRSFKAILVTGGCGFIGSNFLLYMVRKYPDTQFVNVDLLTYAARREHLATIETAANYVFVKEDIVNTERMLELLKKFKVDAVVNFAAESHVDRSFEDAQQFVHTNVLGACRLMDAVRMCGSQVKVFLHVSTDEVYGEQFDSDRPRLESDVFAPTNPYSASKVAAEVMGKSYLEAWSLPLIVTRGNNCYGPNQHPEKVVPKFVLAARKGQPLTIQGDGAQKRAFMFVQDAVRAFEVVLCRGRVGEVYNLGCLEEGHEVSVLRLAQLLKEEMDSKSEIVHVADRKHNDFSYRIDSTKLRMLGWEPIVTLKDGLRQTISAMLGE